MATDLSGNFYVDYNTPSHTPGPWKVAGQGDGNQQLPILASRHIIAAVRDDGRLADAYLIAAAPDLLAACKALFDAQSSRKHPLGDPNEGIATKCAEAASKARAAIAKAEGLAPSNHRR